MSVSCFYNTDDLKKLYGLSSYNSRCISYNNLGIDDIKTIIDKISIKEKKVIHHIKFTKFKNIPVISPYKSIIDNFLEENIKFEFGITYSNNLTKQKKNYLIPVIKICNNEDQTYNIKLRISMINSKGELTEGCFINLNISKTDTYYCYDYLKLNNLEDYRQPDGSIKFVLTILSMGKTSDMNKLNECMYNELKSYSEYVEEMESPKASLASLVHKIIDINYDKTDEDDINDLQQMSNKEIAKFKQHNIILNNIIDEIIINKQSQEKKESEKQLCCICQDNIIDTIFTPCGHFISCATCAEILMTNQKKYDSDSDESDYEDDVECPICKQYIEKTQKVYM